jgi:hypothetical protein
MPAWMAIGEIAIMVWFVLALVAILLYAPFWVVGGLRKRLRRPAERAIRLWPLIATLSLVLTVLIFQRASSDLIARLGNVTAWSVGLCVSTLLFGIAAAASVLALLLARRKEVRRLVYWGSVAVIVPLAIVAVYFAYWGVIGVRMWA